MIPTKTMWYRTTWSGRALFAAFCLGVTPFPCLPASAPAATAPELDELAEVVVQAPEPRFVAPTLRDRIGRVWVPVMLDGKGPFRLVLDSGAVRSAVIPAVATALQLPTDRTPPVVLHGVTGSTVAPTISVDTISVGDLHIGPAVLPIIADAFGGAEGLLGTLGMEDKRIYIDFRNDFVNISLSRNQRATREFTVIPVIRHNLPLLAVQGHAGGVPALAIIDTGAQTTVGNEALRRALERQLRQRALSSDAITGATGDTQIGEGARVSPIDIGEITIREAHITFGDMHIFRLWNLVDEPAVLIGMDILGLLDTLVIDYQRRELHVKPHRQGMVD